MHKTVVYQMFWFMSNYRTHLLFQYWTVCFGLCLNYAYKFSSIDDCQKLQLLFFLEQTMKTQKNVKKDAFGLTKSTYLYTFWQN